MKSVAVTTFSKAADSDSTADIYPLNLFLSGLFTNTEDSNNCMGRGDHFYSTLTFPLVHKHPNI